MKRQRWYVGCKGTSRIAFRTAIEPTEVSHGTTYNAVIGPFRTKRGAQFMAKYGANNPHCQTVAEAEKLAAKAIKDDAAPYS
jgi:hypothetical protein